MADFVDLQDEGDDFEEPMAKRRVYYAHFDAFNEYDDEKFRKRYRFSKNSVNDLVNLLGADLERTANRTSTVVAAEEQVLLALRYYGGGAFQLLTGDTLHISQPSVCKAVSAVSNALCRRLDDFVVFPEGESARLCKRKFYDIAGFPNVISAIDCTHIRIVKPPDHPEQYFNRKRYPSLNVQAACDAEYRFTNVYVKWNGASHDSFILQQSELWRTMEEDGGRGIVVGDSAYPCRFWLMTPILAPTTAPENLYNKVHCKTRVCIEQAFGMLKKRFNALHQENRRKLEHVVKDIAACVVLYNYGMKNDDPNDFDDLQDHGRPVATPVPPFPPPAGHNVNFGLQRRRRIMNQLMANS